MARPTGKRSRSREVHVDAAPPSPPSLWARRGTLIIACLALFLFVYFACAGHMWAAALYRLLTELPLLAAWLGAMLGVGTLIYRCFGVRDEQAPLPYATCTALGMGAYSLLTLGLGLAGILNRGMAIVLIVAGIGVGLALLPWRRANLKSEISNLKPDAAAQSVDPAAWLWLLAMPFLAIAVLGAFMPPGILWGPGEPNGYDVLEYHLQVPREWYDAGRIFALHHNVFSYFPFNVEMHYLLAMHLRGGPWAGMYLAQLMHVTMVALTVAAVAGFAQKRGRLGTLLVAVTPWLAMLASVAYNEGGLLLLGTLAIGWAWRAIEAPPAVRSRAMALAGVMAGLACGVKLTAVPMLLIAVPLVFGAVMALRRERWMGAVIGFVICGVIVFSPWLIRNLAWAQNPVFPEEMKLLGRAHFSEDQVQRWERAHGAPEAKRTIGARLTAAWEQIFADWRFGYVILPAAALTLVYPLVSRRPNVSPSHGTSFLAALATVWLLFWLFLTHLEGRFFVLTVPALGMILARVQLPIARLALLCGLLLQSGFGMLSLQAPIANQFLPFRDFIGIDAFPMPEEIADAPTNGGESVCLIGDTTAFRYPLPSSRLHYRTVFDVDARARPVEDAWADGCPRQPGDVLLLDFNELARFARTYYAIPPSRTGGEGRVVVRVQK
jgi:hypothetical protein